VSNSILDLNADSSVAASKTSPSEPPVFSLSLYNLCLEPEVVVPPVVPVNVTVPVENPPAPIVMAKKASSHQVKSEENEAEEKKPAAKPAKEEKPAPVKQEVNTSLPQSEPELAKTPTCTKTCTDKCLATDGATVQGLIVCLNNCKCDQPAAESLLKSKNS